MPTEKKPPTAEWLRRLCFAVPVLLLLISAWNMGAFWTDEAEMVHWFTRPLPQLIETLRNQITPLAFPLLAKLWLGAFGGLGEHFALRTLGFLLSVGAVGFVWWIGRTFGADKAHSVIPLAPAVVLSTAMLVRILGTTRAYGLSALALTGLILFLLLFIRNGQRRHVVGATCFALLAFHSHYLNIFPVLTLSLATLYAVGRRSWQVIVPMAMAGATLLVYAPWVSAAQSWTHLVREGRDLQRILIPLGLLFGTAFKPLPVIAFGTWLAGIYLFIHRLKRAEGSHKSILRFGLVAALGIPVLSVAGMFLTATGGMQWYFVPPMVACACCLQLAFAPNRPLTRRILWGATILLLATNVFTARPLLQPIGQADKLAAFVTAQAKSGDTIIATPWPVGVSFSHYYRGPIPFVTSPPTSDTTIIRYDLVNASLDNQQLFEEFLENMRRSLKSGKRVYIVGTYGGSVPEPPKEPTPRRLFVFRMDIWAYAIQDLLGNHSTQVQMLETNPDGTNEFEAFQVRVFEGWRD